MFVDVVFSVAWSRGAATVDVHGTFVRKRVDSDFVALVPSLVSNAGYVTWDVGASYRAWRRMTRFARVQNVANVHYMEPLGYSALQRTGRSGIRVAS
jgi:outer membrane cobalamin receptor